MVLYTAMEINNIQLWDIKTVLRNVLSSGARPAGDEAGDGGGNDEHKSHSLWECEFCECLFSATEIPDNRRICLESSVKKIWPCTHCDQTFKLRSRMSKHLKNVHGELLDSPPVEAPGAFCEVSGSGKSGDHDYFTLPARSEVRQHLGFS